MTPAGHQCHEFPPTRLHGGEVLERPVLAFATHGHLSPARDNAILFPTWFGSTHLNNAWLIGPGRALDPARHFIVCVNLLGNGLSSSPSNTAPPHDGPRFPAIHVLDNVRLQRRLLRERFGIDVLQLVVGRSMGAQTAFQWAASHPSEVRRMLALCGSARTTPHNQVFLASLAAALKADQTWNGGDYAEPPVAGLRALGHAYAAWAMSPAFYRRGLHLEQAVSVDDYIARRWADNFIGRDANDLLGMMSTWRRADVGDDPAFRGDWKAALRAITCPAIVMPSRTDMYFPPEDSAAAVAHMPAAELRVIESVWGHRAGSPGSDPADIAAVDTALRELLRMRA